MKKRKILLISAVCVLMVFFGVLISEQRASLIANPETNQVTKAPPMSAQENPLLSADAKKELITPYADTPSETLFDDWGNVWKYDAPDYIASVYGTDSNATINQNTDNDYNPGITFSDFSASNYFTIDGTKYVLPGVNSPMSINLGGTYNFPDPSKSKGFHYFNYLIFKYNDFKDGDPWPGGNTAGTYYQVGENDADAINSLGQSDPNQYLRDQVNDKKKIPLETTASYDNLHSYLLGYKIQYQTPDGKATGMQNIILNGVMMPYEPEVLLTCTAASPTVQVGTNLNNWTQTEWKTALKSVTFGANNKDVDNYTVKLSSGQDGQLSNSAGTQVVSIDVTASPANFSITTGGTTNENPTVKQTIQVTFNLVETPWLSDYSTWQNPTKKTIPATNAFTLIPTADTKVVGTPTGMAKDTTTETQYNFDFSNETTNTISLSNIGYYQGKPVGVTVAFTPNGTGTNSGHVSIDPASFLSYEITGKVTVAYTFWQGEPSTTLHDFNGYATLQVPKQGQSITLNDLPSAVYCGAHPSTNESPQGTWLEYKTTGNQMNILNQTAGDLTALETHFTILFSGGTLSYTVNSGSTAFDSGWTNQTYSGLLIDMPAPMGVDLSNSELNTITTDNINSDGSPGTTPLVVSQFIQQIPYEETYTDELTWTLPNLNGVLSVINGKNWEVANLAANQTTGNKEITDGTYTVVGSSVSSESGTYYLFTNYLAFDTNQSLQSSDVTKLNQNQGVLASTSLTPSLKVGNNDPLDTPSSDVMKSAPINFKTTVNYEYQVWNGTELEDFPSGSNLGNLQQSKAGYIMQQFKDILDNNLSNITVPLNSAEVPYTADFTHNDPPEETPILYSSTTAKLAYMQTPGGEVAISTVPSALAFETKQIASDDSGNVSTEQSASTWSINITDLRTTHSAMDLQAELSQEAGQVFPTGASVDVGNASLNVATSGAQTIQTLKNLTLGVNTVTWSQGPDGFQLVAPVGSVRANTPYSATLTFTLVDSPSN